MMTTRYCDEDSGCGPIPPSLGMCSNLLDLTLSHGRLSGSIPNELTQLVNLLNFDVSNNKLTGELPNDIGNLVNLTSLDVSNNHLSGSIPAFLPTNLEYIYLDNNHFEGTLDANVFTNLTSLKELYLSFNAFTGSVPYLNNHHALVSIMLHSNSFSEIRTDTFRGTNVLETLSLARQNSSEIEMEEYAFRGVSSEANIILSGNTIRDIPAGLFEGRQNALVDLQNLGIVTLASDAFSDTSNISILLSGNSISSILPDAFSSNTVQAGQSCTDFVGWTEYCVELNSEMKCDKLICTDLPDPLPNQSFAMLVVGTPGSGKSVFINSAVALNPMHLYTRSAFILWSFDKVHPFSSIKSPHIGSI